MWIFFEGWERLGVWEVIILATTKKTPAGTNAQKVAQQNNASAQNLENQTTEFASETDVSSVRQKNQKSQQNKKG